jgi:peptide-methionine (S)-S-oxide reductase
MLFTNACSGDSTRGRSPVNPIPDIPAGMRSAVLGAGCFWCVEAYFERVAGVQEVISGYAGGTTVNPNYKEVSQGASDQVEVVMVIYDPLQVSYRALIDFFWTTHDASKNNGVWPDFGPQYRSILLYSNASEKDTIAASRNAYQSAQNMQIATEIKALKMFYTAETYHQDFAQLNPKHNYIQQILVPKLKKLGFSL